MFRKVGAFYINFEQVQYVEVMRDPAQHIRQAVITFSRATDEATGEYLTEQLIIKDSDALLVHQICGDLLGLRKVLDGITNESQAVWDFLQAHDGTEDFTRLVNHAHAPADLHSQMMNVRSAAQVRFPDLKAIEDGQIDWAWIVRQLREYIPF